MVEKSGVEETEGTRGCAWTGGGGTPAGSSLDGGAPPANNLTAARISPIVADGLMLKTPGVHNQVNELN